MVDGTALADLRRVVRGEVWLASKSRPCVIISPPEMHNHLRTVIVAPMTTGSRPAPWRIPIAFDGKQGLILLDQVRAIDKQRLIKRFGIIKPVTLSTVLERLREVFAD